MASDQSLKERSKQQVIQTEKWAREKGYSVLRIIQGDKQPPPVDHNYNDSQNYKVPGPEAFLLGQWGIGVVTGPQRKGPIDIDHDAMESLFFGPVFLPPTNAVFGRTGKPQSHRMYCDPNITAQPTLKFADPVSKSSIIELRADGGNQTVMPGTIHASGELVGWAKVPFPDVAEVVAEELARCTAKVAVAVLVVRYLWGEGSRNDVCLCLAGMFFYMKWPLHEAEQFIQAVCDYTGDQESGDRLRNVRITYRKGEKGEKIRGATALKTKVLSGPGIEAVVNRILEWLGPTSSSVVMEMNEQFACVSLEGAFRIVYTDVNPGASYAFQTKDNFLDMYGPFVVAGHDGKPVSKAKLWLSSAQRRFYPRVDFMPGVSDQEGVFNLWSGWAVEPDPNASCEAWLELLWSIVCNEDEGVYFWMLNWLAHMFQFSMQKAHTCPVIIGVPGAGKTLLMTYLSRILGSAYFQVTKPEHVQGRFNAHQRHTLLLHSDEALYARDKKHRAVIKSLITDERQVHEAKGIDASLVRSTIRLVLTSNYDHAAPAEEKDRRFTIIHMRDRRVSVELRRRVVKELDGTGPAALLHYLQQYQVDCEWVNQNIKNADWLTNVLEQSDVVLGWWQGVLQGGILVPEYLSWATDPADEPWPRVVGTRALYTYFIEDTKSNGQSWGKMSQMAFSNRMNELTGGVRKRHMRQFFPPTKEEALDHSPRWAREIPGSQKAILDMPPLERCRRAFDQYVGYAGKWDDPTLHMNPETPPDQLDGVPEY